MFEVTDRWRETYPGAAVGLLAMSGVANPAHHPALERRKEALEGELRARFAGYDRPALRALPILQAYADYYRRFKKTYHVQLQLESVALKGKSIPGGAALVEAMFMAELANLLLTAGHDLDAIEPPVRIDVAEGTETYTALSGTEQQLKTGDMTIADAQGVLSSILYGPDQRTRIVPTTRRVLFTVYAPAATDPAAVRHHLEEIRDLARLVAPAAEVELLQVYRATL
jgi:DNA/RNA-binding domain of Phe-tRNA-synthetase-like protein